MTHRDNQDAIFLKTDMTKFDNALTVKKDGSSQASHYAMFPKNQNYGTSIMILCTGDIFNFLGNQSIEQRSNMQKFKVKLNIYDNMETTELAQA